MCFGNPPCIQLRLAAILWLGLMVIPVPAAADEPVSIVVSQTWDFGYLPQKCEVSHCFWLYNDGEEPLTVTKIKSGCSCTTVSEVDRPIPPGDSAAITVTFKSGRYLRNIKKTTTVFTDNPDKPEHHLHLTANVIKRDEMAGEFKLQPRKLIVSPTEKPERIDTVLVTNIGSDTVATHVLHCPKCIAGIDGVAQELIPGQSSSWAIHLVNESLETGPTGLSVTFAFAGADETRVTLPIEVRD